MGLKHKKRRLKYSFVRGANLSLSERLRKMKGSKWQGGTGAWSMDVEGGTNERLSSTPWMAERRSTRGMEGRKTEVELRREERERIDASDKREDRLDKGKKRVPKENKREGMSEEEIAERKYKRSRVKGGGHRDRWETKAGSKRKKKNKKVESYPEEDEDA